ncbi:MAG TPA: preprotein translocase subunit SecG [Actinobacteria bacterium]|nr:preprotein translocase subunit SecG [Actinomycetota bacterium]
MQIFTAILVVLHLIVSATLIFLILLHSGKGGGMSDMFGGGGMQSSSSGGATLAERNLDRLTVFVAIAFTITTILLVLFIGQ